MALGEEDKPVFIAKSQRKSSEKPESKPEVPFDAPRSILKARNAQQKPKIMQSEKPQRSRSKGFVFGWNDAEDTSKLSELEVVPLATCRKRDEIELEDRARNWRELSLSEMTSRDWRFLRDEFSISLKPSSLQVNPIRFWNEAAFPDKIHSVLLKMRFSSPTPIQRQAIPAILSGRDVVGISPTGSGKTAAFSIPLVIQLDSMARLNCETMANGPYALVLAPTRELAQQINEGIRQFSHSFGIRTLCLIGGHSISEQSFEMRDGIEVVVGTPGRLRDCIEQHLLVLNQTRFVILDEADKMMDMGFGDDVEMLMGQFMSNGVKNKQVCMFSATMPNSVCKLISRYFSKNQQQQQHLTVSVGEISDPIDSVNQIIEMLPDSNSKISKALEIINQGHFKAPIILFCNSKKTVDDLCKFFQRRNSHRIVSLHGGKSQESRESALRDLSQGKADLLIATDVAGRGIDIPNVSLVLNVDMPVNMQVYTHRIGRTGRAGATGTAITLICEEDCEIFWELAKYLKKAKNCKVPEVFWKHPKVLSKTGGSIQQQKKKHEQIVYSL